MEEVRIWRALMAQIIPARIALVVSEFLNSKPPVAWCRSRGREQPFHGYWVRLMKLGKLVDPRAKYGLKYLMELSCNLFSPIALHLHVLEIVKGPWWGQLGRFCSLLWRAGDKCQSPTPNHLVGQYKWFPGDWWGRERSALTAPTAAAGECS